jgi:hypothetical protein
VINLTWNDEGMNSGARKVLRDAGIINVLRELMGSEDLDLADRAGVAIEQIDDIDVGGDLMEEDMDL